VLRLAHAGPKDPATHAALQALLALPAKVRRHILHIAAPNPDRVTLALTGDRTVIWGDGAHSARKAKVLVALLRRPGTAYDLSGGDVVTVR
jgi:cell division protein FtsQ